MCIIDGKMFYDYTSYRCHMCYMCYTCTTCTRMIVHRQRAAWLCLLLRDDEGHGPPTPMF